MAIVRTLCVIAAAFAAATTAHLATESVLNPRIAGGQPADSAKYSFVANIESVDPVYTGKNCTGALITERLVMTTANCLMTGSYTWFNPRLMSVSFGPDVYDVRQALISDGFKHESFAHNVGLIILASPVPDSVATPVKIYSGSLATSTHVVAAGFGLTGRSTNPYPTRPHVAPLSIMDHRNCSAFAGFDSSTQLCVEGASGADLCMGDEGAPLLVTGSEEHSVALLGVASYITKSASSSGSRLVMCGGNGNVAYFEMSRSWAQWISKVAHVTYNDIIISLNITTDSDKHHAGNSSLYSQSMSDASDGVAEGPLSVSESVLESGGGKLVSLALDAAFAAIVFAAIL